MSLSSSASVGLAAVPRDFLDDEEETPALAYTYNLKGPPIHLIHTRMLHILRIVGCQRGLGCGIEMRF